MAYQVNGVHVLTDAELRERIEGVRVEALALAWRWLRAAASEDEAGEMVVEALKDASEDPALLANVITEAKRWDTSEKTSEQNDREQ
jgi:nitrogen regulatory protein PII-like uncharacterized protein